MSGRIAGIKPGAGVWTKLFASNAAKISNLYVSAGGGASLTGVHFASAPAAAVAADFAAAGQYANDVNDATAAPGDFNFIGPIALGNSETFWVMSDAGDIKFSASYIDNVGT